MRFEFQLVERAGGWGLLDNGKPILWFPEWANALEIARLMADARNTFHGVPAYVHALSQDGQMEMVADYE